MNRIINVSSIEEEIQYIMKRVNIKKRPNYLHYYYIVKNKNIAYKVFKFLQETKLKINIEFGSEQIIYGWNFPTIKIIYETEDFLINYIKKSKPKPFNVIINDFTNYNIYFKIAFLHILKKHNNLQLDKIIFVTRNDVVLQKELSKYNFQYQKRAKKVYKSYIVENVQDIIKNIKKALKDNLQIGIFPNDNFNKYKEILLNNNIYNVSVYENLSCIEKNDEMKFDLIICELTDDYKKILCLFDRLNNNKEIIFINKYNPLSSVSKINSLIENIKNNQIENLQDIQIYTKNILSKHIRTLQEENIPLHLQEYKCILKETKYNNNNNIKCKNIPYSKYKYNDVGEKTFLFIKGENYIIENKINNTYYIKKIEFIKKEENKIIFKNDNGQIYAYKEKEKK